MQTPDPTPAEPSPAQPAAPSAEQPAAPSSPQRAPLRRRTGRGTTSTIALTTATLTTATLTAIALAAAVARWWPQAGAGIEGPAFWLLLALYLLLSAVSAVLAVVDLVSHTLPNAILLPSGAVVLALVIAASAAAGDPGLLTRSLVCGLALGIGYGLLWRGSPRSLGGGDVKLAALLGAALGPLGWGSALVGAVVPFLLGGAFAAVLLIVHGARSRAGSGADPRHHPADPGGPPGFPFGPWMLVGAWTGVFAGADIAAGILTPA